MKTRLLQLTRDLRNPADAAALEQVRADAAIESEWRRRVRENPKERAALARRMAQVNP